MTLTGSNSIDPLVPDIHANPSTKKPPDPNQQPFQRITRSMTKLGTSISNITTKKLVDIQIENFSSRPLSSDNIVKMVKTIFSDDRNIQAIKNLTSSTSAYWTYFYSTLRPSLKATSKQANNDMLFHYCSYWFIWSYEDFKKSSFIKVLLTTLNQFRKYLYGSNLQYQYLFIVMSIRLNVKTLIKNLVLSLDS